MEQDSDGASEPVYARIQFDNHVYEELEQQNEIQFSSLSSDDLYDAQTVDENNNQVPHDFMSAQMRLRQSGWYWGPLSREMASHVVNQQPDGAFLIRDSNHDCYLLTVTVKAQNKVFNIRMQHVDNGKFTFDTDTGDTELEPSDAISYLRNAMRISRFGRFYFVSSRGQVNPQVEVKFLHPISRFSVLPVSSLKHLARFAILTRCRKDHICQLELPDHLKAYLNQSQIYVEFEDDS